MDALQRVGGGARDDLPRLDVAGQRDEANVRVRDEPLAGRDTVARDDVQHARGQHVGGELGEAKQRERRLLGRLQHLRVPGGERRSELPDGHHQRVVPRRDPGDDPERLAADHRRVAAHVLARALALEQARRAREEAQVVDAHRDLVARVGERLADVRRLDPGELLGVLLQHPREREQRLGALARRRVEPLRQRRLRGGDCGVDLLDAAVRHRPDDLLGRRVENIHRRAHRRDSTGASRPRPPPCPSCCRAPCRCSDRCPPS